MIIEPLDDLHQLGLIKSQLLKPVLHYFSFLFHSICCGKRKKGEFWDCSMNFNWSQIHALVSIANKKVFWLTVSSHYINSNPFIRARLTVCSHMIPKNIWIFFKTFYFYFPARSTRVCEWKTSEKRPVSVTMVIMCAIFGTRSSLEWIRCFRRLVCSLTKTRISSFCR